MPCTEATATRISGDEVTVRPAARIALSLSFALASLLLARPAFAQEAKPTGLDVHWSLSPMAVYTGIPSPENNDDVGGFFDQYNFTPNKSRAFPLQLGLRDASLDLWQGFDSTPLLQVRFDSPTSNLGVTGSEIDQPFFNQRLAASARLRGIDVDLFYQRLRTEALRIFPNTEGPGLVFRDLTSPDDRFFRDRTGFALETTLRLHEVAEIGEALAGWSPALSLRGGLEERGGTRQLRFIVDPSNQWFGFAEDLDSSVGDVGASLVLAPEGLLTVSFDFDYQRYRFDSGPITEAALGIPPPGAERTIGFVPSSDRYTGSVRFNSAIGERAVLEGGFQVVELEQSGQLTPRQISAGLDHNSVRYYGANAGFDVVVSRDLSLNGYFEFEQRNNDIQRDTALFNPSNGTQIDPFLKSWRRIDAGAALEWRMRGANRASIGIDYEDIDRDLSYPDVGTLRILPVNAQIRPRTRIVDFFARTSLRPWTSLSLDLEIGYRIAPRTGYIVDLDNELYGELRTSYLVRLPQPLALSLFVQGSRGENDQFSVVSGQGPVPAGPTVDRSYERSRVTAGFTASLSPSKRLHLFTSLFFNRDDQDASLDLSSIQRYFQDLAPVTFVEAGTNRFENNQMSLIVGGRFDITERSDVRLRYGFTYAKAKYRGGNALLDLSRNSRIIDSRIHDIDLRVSHRLRAGLRVFAGYRFQLYNDDAPVLVSDDSTVAPFDPSTYQHTVTLGITLTSELIARERN